jgi:hypothetical protein
MAFHFSPKATTDGLIFLVDAANQRSYVSGSSTWTDLSKSAKNATFVTKTPAYLSAANGSLDFNDADFGYGDTNYNFGNLSNWTVEAWAKIGKSLNGKVTTIVTNQYDLSNQLNFSLGTNNAPSSYNLVAGFFNLSQGGWKNTTGHTPPLNTWFQIVGSYDGSTIKQYYNGIVTSSLSFTGTSLSGGTVRIATRWDDLTQTTSNYFSGSIGIVKIYNRTLSDIEVLQNYNTTKGRFGLN